jgi:hypothetical protein
MLPQRRRRQRRYRRLRGDAVLGDWHRYLRDVRQYVPGEVPAFFNQRVSGEDERPDAHIHIAIDFREHLRRAADQRAAATRTGFADFGPKVRLYETERNYVEYPV